MKSSKLIDFCASLRLTLPLLFGLAGIAVFGTIWPSRDTELEVLRYELFYQSPWFRLLLGLLAINLIACTLRLIQRRRQEARQWSSRLVSTAGIPVEISAPAAVLHKHSYQLCQTEDGWLALRHSWARWSVLIVHLSVLLIMTGALLGGAGFVGTLNIYNGDSSDYIFDWDQQHDRPLGFTFRLDHFAPIFYPIELRFAAIDPNDGHVINEFQVFEGETVNLPSGELQAKVTKFDPLRKELHLDILQHGQPVRQYLAKDGVRDPDNTIAGMVLYPLAFKDPMLKQYHSEVSILEDGRVVKQGIIRINQPLTWRGVTIYQTSFNMGEQQRLYGGFQFSRDPGEALVWAGAILLSLGLLANLCWRCRVLGLRKVDNGWQLLPLRGFNGDDGRLRLEKLREQLLT